MEVFKLAFETTIVGISAFLWLGIAIDLLSPNFLARVRSALDGVNPTLTGAVLLATTYCVGSAILPISDQLVNDEHWPLPEDAIRCRVAVEEGNRLNLVRYTTLTGRTIPQASEESCSCSFWSRLRWGDQGNGKNSAVQGSQLATLKLDHDTSDEGTGQLTQADVQRKTILTRFELLESRALGQGANKEELFRQLRERIVVLRGVVFSGFVLFLICLFGCIAPERGQSFNRGRTLLGIMLASACTAFVVYSGYEDLVNPNIFDIPVLEATIAAITVFGGFLVVKGVRRRPFMRVQFLVVIALAAALSYGGWIWSEVL